MSIDMVEQAYSVALHDDAAANNSLTRFGSCWYVSGRGYPKRFTTENA
jgi:hypothetical protein